MTHYGLAVLLAIAPLVVLAWLIFGGNQINEPFHPVGPATLHACGGALDSNGSCGPIRVGSSPNP